MSKRTFVTLPYPNDEELYEKHGNYMAHVRSERVKVPINHKEVYLAIRFYPRAGFDVDVAQTLQLVIQSLEGYTIQTAQQIRALSMYVEPESNVPRIEVMQKNFQPDNKKESGK